MRNSQIKGLTRKEQIINAARKLVIKRGSENITVRQIAEEVGFSEAAIYRHFKSKKDILYLLIESIEANLISDLESTARPELDRLENILMSHLSAVEMRRGISFQVIAEIVSLGDKQLNKRINETLEKYIGKLEEILEEEIDKGNLRNDLDANAASVVIFSVIQGLSNLWMLSNYNFDPLQKFAPILALLRKGLT